MHTKLKTADKLVHDTLRLLDDNRNRDEGELAALRLELSLLNIGELDVDTEILKLQVSDELAELRKSVESGDGGNDGDERALPVPMPSNTAAADMPPAPPATAGTATTASVSTAEISQLQARIKDLEVENRNARDLLRETKQEAQNLRSELNQKQAGTDVASTSIADSGNATAATSSTTPSKSGEFKVTVTGVASGSIQTHVDELQRDLIQKNKELLQFKSQCAQLQTELEVQQLNLVDMKEHHQVESNGLKEQMSVSEVTIQQLKNQVSMLEKQQASQAAAAKDPSVKMAQITEADLGKLRSELLEINNQVVAFQRTEQTDKAKIAADKAALDESKTALNNLLAAEKDQEAAIAELKVDLAASQAECVSLKKSAAETASNSAAELIKLQDDLKAAVAAKQTEGAKLVAEIQSSKTALAALETKHSDAVANHAKEMKTLAATHAAEVTSLTSKFEEEKEELMEALSQEIEEVETTLKAEAAVLEKQVEDKVTELKLSENKRLQQNQFVIKVYKRFLTFKTAHRQLKMDTNKKLAEYKSVLATIMSPSLITRCQEYQSRYMEMGAKVKEGVLERKRLHNVIQELKGNIRVYLRCRPPSQKELSQFGQDAQCVSFPLSSVDVDGISDGGSMVRVVNEKGRDKTWEFDQVFDLQSTQESVYKEVSELVTSMMDGYNVCIFAYGQTGSGKTFTMAGPPDNCGVNTRALEELFNKSSKRHHDYNDVITVSVLEVYNEEIRDLLTESNGEKLEVRQSSDGTGNFVPGLTIVRVNSLQDVVQLLAIADKFRTSASTNMNEHSSRSHMMLTVYVQSENRHTGAISRGKLNLVDLAGSERLNKSGATGTALKEAQNINKSLSALGDVIAARAAKQGHIPFRNSTLTYLLQDSLSQDSKTLMFVCISPVVYNAEETFCSLNFAAR